MQQMHWREALEEARGDRDGAALQQLTAVMTAERDRLIASIGSALDGRGDAAAAAGLVRRLMFVDRFREELRDAAAALSSSQGASA
jgi:molecular chaperone HscB